MAQHKAKETAANVGVVRCIPEGGSAELASVYPSRHTHNALVEHTVHKGHHVLRVELWVALECQYRTAGPRRSMLVRHKVHALHRANIGASNAVKLAGQPVRWNPVSVRVLQRLCREIRRGATGRTVAQAACSVRLVWREQDG